MDDDGRAETLRLLFATPRRWMQDGQRIQIERAPTAFGEVSILAHSALSKGEVSIDVALPTRAASKTLLRLRLPAGWKIKSAAAADQPLEVNDETIDLSGLKGNVSITARVRR
jgi:hypothetical protein